jgi:regulator of replication initiation timing
LEAGVKSFRLKALDKKREFEEIRQRELLEGERHWNFEKRIVNLRAEIEEMKKDSNETFFERAKFKLTLDQHKAVLTEDELRMRDFYETVHEIDSAGKHSFRLEHRFLNVQNESVDFDIRALDNSCFENGI